MHTISMGSHRQKSAWSLAPHHRNWLIESELPEAGKGSLLLLSLIIVALLLVGVFYLGGARQPKVQAPAVVTASCAKVKGPLKDKADAVVQANGSQYIPYGMTVPGLAHEGYQDFQASDTAEIQAAATSWCVNTIRLQVAQDDLVGANGTTYSSDFMTALEAEVSQAESLGLVVVINAQTQDVGKEIAPTSNTAAFWKAVSSVYGTDPQVVFDIFNEPHNLAGSAGAAEWKDWQKGGTIGGVQYVGMQQLSNAIRADGAKNLIWLEGPDTAQTLASVSSYPVTGDGPIMYAIHHPAGAHNAATWNTDFGYLVNKNIAPVVVGEWTNYASAKGECWPDAPTAVPAFLNYLQDRKIGMTVWTLQSGVLAQSSDLSNPTRIQSNWACQDNLNGTTAPNEGAGNQIMNWFIRQNS